MHVWGQLSSTLAPGSCCQRRRYLAQRRAPTSAQRMSIVSPTVWHFGSAVSAVSSPRATAFPREAQRQPEIGLATSNERSDLSFPDSTRARELRLERRTQTALARLQSPVALTMGTASGPSRPSVP